MFKLCFSNFNKTINNLYERFYSSNGHLNPVTKESALLKHLEQSSDTECQFIFNDIKILDERVQLTAGSDL